MMVILQFYHTAINEFQQPFQYINENNILLSTLHKYMYTSSGYI